MNFKAALQHIKKRTFSPIYLITGDEPYLRDQLRDQFLSLGIEKSAQGFNLQHFQGANCTADAITSLARTFPLMSERRLIFVHQLDQLKDEEGLLLDYISDPSPSSLLVLIVEKPDNRKKLFSTLKKRAVVMTCDKPREHELPLWIRQSAKELGMTLSDEAAWFLKEHIGRDLLSLQRELEKLALSQEEDAGLSQQVSVDLVQKVVGNGRAHSIFELTNAVADKDLSKALPLLNKMVSEGAHPLFILTMLLRQWRQMRMAKQLILAGQPREVAKKVPMPPSLMQGFVKRLKRWSMIELSGAFELSLSADSQLKGGSAMKAKIIIETLLLDLCAESKSQGCGTYSMPFLGPKA